MESVEFGLLQPLIHTICIEPRIQVGGVLILEVERRLVDQCAVLSFPLEQVLLEEREPVDAGLLRLYRPHLPA